MKELTIVTGYFDINRNQWKKYKRSNKDYIEYFKKWGSIKNKLVVFTDSKANYDEVVDFRRKKGLLDKTIVILVENIEEIDKELFYSIQSVTNSKLQREFRLQPGNPEVINAYYNYVMLMKEWCVYEAINKGYASGLIAWVDFGYNHGGQTVLSSDFDDFVWSYDFPDKICMFNCEHIQEERPIFDIVRNMNVYIMGTVIVAPDSLWLKLWDYVREEMYALIHCGLVDDDQTILLMVYLNHKNECELFESSWNRMIPDYSYNKTFNFICNECVKINPLKKVYRKIKWVVYKLNYCLKQYNYIKNLD